MTGDDDLGFGPARPWAQPGVRTYVDVGAYAHISHVGAAGPLGG